MSHEKPRALVVADEGDIQHLDCQKPTSRFEIYWKIVDYRRLGQYSDDIRRLIADHDIDFLLYSRNEQVARKVKIGPMTRSLRIGYSSFSAIDEPYRIAQMVRCYDDLLEGECDLDVDPPRHGQDQGRPRGALSFSIAVDIEQLGCAKYGLPRLLNLLNLYKADATFYVTNLVRRTYPSLPELIYSRGHEIGLHGLWHEYLSDFDTRKQCQFVKEMIEDFGCHVQGANFIGRMNSDTTHALMRHKLGYFVHPTINSYRFIGYPKISTCPARISNDSGTIRIIPISVETYGHPWASIKNMVSSALNDSIDSNSHITILCHGFRDGNLLNIRTTERLLKYLMIERGAITIPVREVPRNLASEPVFGNFEEYVSSSLVSKRILVPTSRDDLLAFLPETVALIRRLLRRKRLIW